MATESITKSYVVKDDKTCDVLIKVLSEKSTRRKPQKPSKKLEKGKVLLERYLSP